jgi:hypothetical protein
VNEEGHKVYEISPRRNEPLRREVTVVWAADLMVWRLTGLSKRCLISDIQIKSSYFQYYLGRG